MVEGLQLDLASSELDFSFSHEMIFLFGKSVREDTFSALQVDYFNSPERLAKNPFSGSFERHGSFGFIFPLSKFPIAGAFFLFFFNFFLPIGYTLLAC